MGNNPEKNAAMRALGATLVGGAKFDEARSGASTGPPTTALATSIPPTSRC